MLPKLYVSVVLGIILFDSSALNTTSSVSSLPIVTLPSAVILPVASKFPKTSKFEKTSVVLFVTSKIYALPPPSYRAPTIAELPDIATEKPKLSPAPEEFGLSIVDKKAPEVTLNMYALPELLLPASSSPQAPTIAELPLIATFQPK